MLYKVYEGGNLRLMPWDALYKADNVSPEHHVEYAAHLKTKHKVVPLFFDAADEAWQRYFRVEVPNGFQVDDELGVTLLAEGTYLEHLVFHNKSAVPGATAQIVIYGVVADTPVGTLVSIRDDAQAARTAANTARTAANTALTTAVTNAGTDPTGAQVAAIAAAQSDLDAADAALAAAQADLDAAQKAVDDAASGMGTAIATFDVDLSTAGYWKFDVDLMLQTNGLISFKLLTEATDEEVTGLLGQCWTISPALVHHNDGHKCSCAPVPCETEYPTPDC